LGIPANIPQHASYIKPSRSINPDFMTPFKPEAIQAMEACRCHAQDLFDGAKLLREKSLPNLAYHLATLALEELGGMSGRS
jgi:hypothetical protein